MHDTGLLQSLFMDTKTPSFEFDIQVSKTIDIYGHQLVLDEGFLCLLRKVYLKTLDLRSMANMCYHKLKQLDYLKRLPGSLLLSVSGDLPNEHERLFEYGAIKQLPLPDFTIVDVVYAHTLLIDREISRAEQSCLDQPRKKQKSMLREMVRGQMGMYIAHELTHAFGVNRRTEQFDDVPLSELELATDAIAFLSCDGLLGDAGYLGVSYLNEQIKKDPSQVASRNIAKKVAIQTVKSLRSTDKGDIRS